MPGASVPLPQEIAAAVRARLERTALIQLGALLEGAEEWGDFPPLVSTIRGVIDAAEGRAAPPAEEVRDAVQAICETLFANPLLLEYEIPESFWAHPLGRVCATALAVTQGADLIHVSEAARLLGWSLSRVGNAIRDGRLQALTVHDRARGRSRRMLCRAEVEALR